MVRNSSNPSWKADYEFFVLPYDQKRRDSSQGRGGVGGGGESRLRTRTSSNIGFASKYANSVLQIEVWDQLSSGGKEFLGVAMIEGDLYNEFDPLSLAMLNSKANGGIGENPASSSSRLWIPLQRSDRISAYLQTNTGGEINISLYPPQSTAGALNGDIVSDADYVEVGIPVAFEITLCGAENLSRADTFGLSDPFCIIKFDGAEIGRTSVQHKTTNPVWSGERFVVSLTLPQSSQTSGGKDIVLPGDASLQVYRFCCWLLASY